MGEHAPCESDLSDDRWALVEAEYVETKNLGGGLDDRPFHLQVVC
ncbi:hypothetical protein [Streptomyces sp. CBMA152]|nr:hypothetical protein [Streptomyces sp. CBMA152]